MTFFKESIDRHLISILGSGFLELAKLYPNQVSIPYQVILDIDKTIEEGKKEE